MFLQELLHRFIKGEAILFVVESVALVLLHHVLHVYAALLQSVYDLV
jgi:hypothetical protein